MADPSTSAGSTWYPPIINLGDSETPRQQPQQWRPSGAECYRKDSSDLGNRSKLRKVERACDYCRKRKSKCDGPQRQDHICTACEGVRTCTYLEDAKPRAPPKAYVLALEDRIHRAETLLRRLRPELDLTSELGPTPHHGRWKAEGASRPSSARSSSSRHQSDSTRNLTSSTQLHALPLLPPLGGATLTLPPQPAAAREEGTKKPTKKKRARGCSDARPPSSEAATSYRSAPTESSDSDDAGAPFRRGARLTSRGLESSESAAMAPNDNGLRFQGKSSSLSLISTTMELIQRELAAMQISDSSNNQPAPAPASATQQPPPAPAGRRDLYYLLPWETRLARPCDLSVLPLDGLLAAFPPLDLAEQLIDLFFVHEHPTFPLLHRPTFEREWREKLYLSSVWFACVCMSAFALGSRWTSDPRVLSEDDDAVSDQSDELKFMPGWKYASVAIMESAAITEMHSGMLTPPEFPEIQTHVLLSQYLRGTVGADAAWYWLSIGVMKAQDMGLHRRKTYAQSSMVEQELWKRTYWHLVVVDRFGSMLLGKQYFAREEDMDVDLPLEVDDEFWEPGCGNPEKAFRQPEGKPSLVTGFVCYIKLSNIVVTILRALYSPRKPKGVSISTDVSWEQAVADRLNEMLLRWADELPTHLRWKSNMPDTPFTAQSATLFAAYHLAQALVQRPFVSLKPGRPIPGSSAASRKAFALCLNASRAGAHIANIQLGRTIGDVLTFLHVLFSAAGILLVHFWDLVRAWGEFRPDEDGAEDIPRKMVEVLDEISRLITRMQELAPKWELARTMLDEIQRALPTNWASMIVEDVLNPAYACSYVPPPPSSEHTAYASVEETAVTSHLAPGFVGMPALAGHGHFTFADFMESHSPAALDNIACAPAYAPQSDPGLFWHTSGLFGSVQPDTRPAAGFYASPQGPSPIVSTVNASFAQVRASLLDQRFFHTQPPAFKPNFGSYEMYGFPF